MGKRPLTAGYVFFYVLFWPDTWRILIGAAASFLIAPRLTPLDQTGFGAVLMHGMLACIGYAASAKPANGVSRFLKKMILKHRAS